MESLPSTVLLLLYLVEAPAPRGSPFLFVSPPMVRETAEKLGWGSGGAPVRDVAGLYVRAVEGKGNAEILRL